MEGCAEYRLLSEESQNALCPSFVSITDMNINVSPIIGAF